MKRLFILFALMATLCGFSFVGNEVLIDSDCIKVSDIFPHSDIDDTVFCDLDYGQVKMINRMLIQNLISKYGIRNEQPKEMIFRRKGVPLTEERFKADLKNKLDIMYPGLSVEVLAIRMGRPYYLPENMQYSIDIPNNRFGDISVTLDNGVKKYTYSVSITAYVDSYVAIKNIAKGERLTDQNSKEKKIDLSMARGATLQYISGYTARTDIPAGRILTENIVDRDPDSLKGAPVFLVHSGKDQPKMMIGTLLEDAYIKKQVHVLDTTTGKVVTGVYVDQKKVLLDK